LLLNNCTHTQKPVVSISASSEEENRAKYYQFLKQVENDPQIGPYLNNETQISFLKRAIEIVIQRNKQEVKYIVRPDLILRVDKEPSSQKINNLKQIIEEIEKLKEQILKSQIKDKLIQKLKELEKQKEILYKQCELRILFDETESKKVREISDPFNPEYIEYEYLNEDYVLKKLFYHESWNYRIDVFFQKATK